MDNGKEYDFGYRNGETYIDHGDSLKRINYWKRHLGNKTEKKLIENLVPSPSLFSAMLLWGKHKDIYQNIDELNKLWEKLHRNKIYS